MWVDLSQSPVSHTADKRRDHKRTQLSDGKCQRQLTYLDFQRPSSVSDTGTFSFCTPDSKCTYKCTDINCYDIVRTSTFGKTDIKRTSSVIMRSAFFHKKNSDSETQQPRRNQQSDSNRAADVETERFRKTFITDCLPGFGHPGTYPKNPVGFFG